MIFLLILSADGLILSVDSLILFKKSLIVFVISLIVFEIPRRQILIPRQRILISRRQISQRPILAAFPHGGIFVQCNVSWILNDSQSAISGIFLDRRQRVDTGPTFVKDMHSSSHTLHW